MERDPEESVEALGAVVGRLGQAHRLWHDALAVYFEPDHFTIAMQSFVTTARSVTFILQSNKSAIPEFDAWYERWRTRFRANPIMRWAVEARNRIEKQGDLDTLSQMRAELIAAYVGNPITDWMPLRVGWSTDRIRRSVPDRFISPHVVDHGVLSIERRWVDSELPENEVLDALAHVYGELALMAVDLHRHLGIAIPERDAHRGEHLLLNLAADGRPPSMERPLEDRAIYVAMKDGSILGYRRDFQRSDPETLKKAQRRYREFRPVQLLTDSSTLMDVAKAFFAMSRVLMAKDGYHHSTFILLKGARQIGVVFAPPQTRADKYMLMRDIARYVRRVGADGLLHVGEAWIAQAEDIPTGGYPDQVPGRREALTMTAANAQGRIISLMAMIQRKLLKKHKVKRLGPTQIEEDQKVYSMAPVLEVWGKIDVLRFNEKDEQWDEWLKTHFGHPQQPEPSADGM